MEDKTGLEFKMIVYSIAINIAAFFFGLSGYYKYGVLEGMTVFTLMVFTIMFLVYREVLEENID